MTHGHTDEPTSGGDDNVSVSSKTDKTRPAKKRMFSLLAPRGSKASMAPVDGVSSNGHTTEPSELSENGLEPGASLQPRTSIGSGFFSSGRRGSTERKHAAELAAQEKERLEERVKALILEKEKAEAALDAEKAETSRLAAEAAIKESEWAEEREKSREEARRELDERDGKVGKLTASVEELQAELERTKVAEMELALFKEGEEARLAEHERRVRESMQEEKEALENKLEGVKRTIELKDATIEKMIAEAAELQEKLTAALEESKKFREEKDTLLKKETDLKAGVGKVKGAGGCSIM